MFKYKYITQMFNIFRKEIFKINWFVKIEINVTIIHSGIDDFELMEFKIQFTRFNSNKTIQKVRFRGRLMVQG